MSEVIKVGMADLNVCKAPDVITTLGLGSCIGLVLYDPVTKVGGMVHRLDRDTSGLMIYAKDKSKKQQHYS